MYYQNVRSLNNKIDELQEVLSSDFFDVIAFTETWLSNDLSSAEFNAEYTIYRRDRGLRGGGVMIAINKNFYSKLFYVSKLMELMAVIVKKGIIRMCIIIVYIPPPVDIDSLQMLERELEEFVLSLEEKFVIYIIGDFNVVGYKPMLRYQVDKCSVFLDDLMHTLDLYQYVTEPTRQNNYLDLIYANCRVDIRYNMNLFSSDHSGMVILMELRIGEVEMDSNLLNIPVLNYSKMDLEHLNMLLSIVDWELILKDGVNESFDNFITVVNAAIRDSTPIIPNKLRKKKFPWCDKEMNFIFSLKNSLHDIWLETKSLFDFELFKNTRSFSKKCFADKKLQYLNDLELSIKSEGIKPFWKYIKSNLKINEIGSIMKYGEKEATGIMEIADLFADFFGSQFNSTDYTMPKYEDFGDSFTELPFITYDSVLNCLGNLQNKYSLSPDGINNIVLINASIYLAQPLTDLFNYSLSKGIFPDCLKMSWITPKHKKGDLSEVSNYRPVAVSPCISKVFEKIIYDHIYQTYKLYFSEEQHGFLPNRSVVSNLIILNTVIIDALVVQAQLDVIYTDFAKAFDSVSHTLLIYKLEKMGFSQGLIDWIESFLNNRKQKVYIKGVLSESFSVNSGVIQGSVLGPLLFLLYVNDIPKCLVNKSLMFADDIKIFSIIRNVEDCYSLQKDIAELYKWCNDWGIHLNVGKCNVMSFRRNFRKIDFSYNINGEIIPRTSKVRDLGIVYTDDFRFRDHVRLIVSNASKSLGFLKRVSFPFEKSSTLICIYNYLIRSKLEFAASVWNNCIKVDVDSIERIQYKFLTYLCYKTQVNYKMISYTTLCKVFNFRMLKERRLKFDLRFLYNIIHGKINCSYLLNLVSLNVPSRINRKYELFYIPMCRTSYMQFSPLVRSAKFCNLWRLSPFMDQGLFMKECDCIFKLQLQ